MHFDHQGPEDSPAPANLHQRALPARSAPTLECLHQIALPRHCLRRCMGIKKRPQLMTERRCVCLKSAYMHAPDSHRLTHCCRSLNFWTLPVGVSGSSETT